LIKTSHTGKQLTSYIKNDNLKFQSFLIKMNEKRFIFTWLIKFASVHVHVLTDQWGEQQNWKSYYVS